MFERRTMRPFLSDRLPTSVHKQMWHVVCHLGGHLDDCLGISPRYNRPTAGCKQDLGSTHKPSCALRRLKPYTKPTATHRRLPLRSF
jgi:hypothetical protein